MRAVVWEKPGELKVTDLLTEAQDPVRAGVARIGIGNVIA